MHLLSEGIDKLDKKEKDRASKTKGKK